MCCVVNCVKCCVVSENTTLYTKLTTQHKIQNRALFFRVGIVACPAIFSYFEQYRFVLTGDRVNWRI